MRIGIVCYPTFGGSGVVATELGLALSQRGHEVHFITYKQPVRLSGLNPSVHFHEVHVPEYALFHYQPYELALSSKLVDMVKMHQIELLHVHYAIPHAYAAYMAKQMLLKEGIQIPIVTTLHGSDITLVGKHPFYRPAVNFSINASDVVTCVSENLKQDTLSFFDVEKEIQVIYNFIEALEDPISKKDCQRGAMAQPHERIITHVSNFRPAKRIQDVIEIFNGIQQKIPSKLMMIGEGPERLVAEQLCESLGISEKVLFFGNTNEVAKILCFSDLFLLPSEFESFGLAALEAMNSRVPVISSNTGGIPEVNIHGVSGFLADVGDVKSMISFALDILKDDQTLEKFKQQAAITAQAFDINNIVPQYEEVYRKALLLYQ